MTMMKKGNVTILASILAIALVAAGVGAGTMAWFSATAVTSGSSTFTAGELKIEVTDNSFHTPLNWAPGDTATFTFTVRNIGNIDIKYMLARDTGYTHNDHNGDGSDLANAILITELHEYVLDASASQVADAMACDVVAYEHAICNSWGVAWNNELTLAEWMSGLKPGTKGGSDYDMIMYPKFAGAYDTLQPWYYYKFTMSLKFDENAGNEYQLDTCSFNIEVYATQGPLTSLPGYVP
jgi:predicted ribosomally synthesized peptide with SipW-like signal peptide